VKAIVVMFDSLNRRHLPAYGGQDVHAPNFARLAERTTVFDNCYAGSMPCMPARREMHTGRYNFLHRGWGPLEPFDDSAPQLLTDAGVHTHLATDHAHYWEDGGATYHNRYSTFEFVRGQESDPWKAMVQPPWERFREMYHPKQFTQERRHKHSAHMINRESIREYGDFPSVRCFDAGFEFLEGNRKAQDWLLHLETFDPHEPFHAPEAFRKDYPTSYKGPIFDFPPYKRVTETIEECDELRANYAAIVALCDHELGRLLDYMDEHAMWDDTALVVTTDHGFLLGEHDWWAKNRMPLYEEISHIPLFIHHPDFATHAGERRQSLTQTIDLMPTFCELFGARIPSEVEGKSLLRLLERDEPQREAAMFGYWGGGVNVVDGRYTYFCYPRDMKNQDLYQYTLMPAHMTKLFTVEELKSASLVPPFAWTKGVPLLRIAHKSKADTKTHSYHFPEKMEDTTTVLYDLETDPGQTTPVDDQAVKKRLKEALFRMMTANDAPQEAIARMKESLGS